MLWKYSVEDSFSTQFTFQLTLGGRLCSGDDFVDEDSTKLQTYRKNIVVLYPLTTGT